MNPLLVIGIVVCIIPCFMNGGEFAGKLGVVGMVLFTIGLIMSFTKKKK